VYFNILRIAYTALTKLLALTLGLLKICERILVKAAAILLV